MTFASKWYIAIRSHPPFSVSLSRKRKQGRPNMTAPASATKLPVAGFRRRRERRTDLFAQAMTTGTAVPAALSGALAHSPAGERVGGQPPQGGSWAGDESAIRLAERAADAKRQYHRLPNGQVVSKCALRDKKEAERPGFPERPCSRYDKCSRKTASSLFSSIPTAEGKTFSKIAPSWISLRVRAFRSFTRSLACASSSRCLAWISFFSSSVKNIAPFCQYFDD